MEKEKNLKVDKQTIILIIVVSLILVGFLVWNNNNRREIEFQREKLEQEKVAEEKKLQEQKDLEVDRKKEEFEKGRQRERDFYNCLNNASDSYKSEWLSFCKVNKYPMYKGDDGEETCNIPANNADTFKDRFLRAKEICVEKYK